MRRGASAQAAQLTVTIIATRGQQARTAHGIAAENC